ncbi:UDP-N-acetylmuramoyl-tripeptide--D-alanyl-D-alanine ligase [Aquisalimonas lutea]|uniref:UDP-N-acetylmuramoyl-tripeptide--D-alanyl-D- alanine ligase n=1 Tax=Aquisalimonas lutea TaxID=1327750 RepID=UPI0025B2F90E|nr:UDP-N-acetylmuramoyl-tripeptide--D-alanyl-D-alanine ligase [Aquisalimonas lutea]MDN3517410.1 UDP-N-acetylmuramoyl-tripeptide--D-alanyl-D-alanine ligase [Aquisalimonas lutea]
MIRYRLDELTTPLTARLEGASVEFHGITTDSRRVAPGELFVALAGERFDGHAYAAAALERGAAAVMVHHEPPPGRPALVVDDTRRALADLARLWRRRSPARVIGLTGSNGKTTVKQMLAAILERAAPTLATQGNLNNDIGVPLTLARLSGEHRYAVIEMGANHLGEIAALTAVAEPEVGLVTNAGPAHLEGFGGLDAVARGKGELFRGLAADGTAVINADDAYADLWRGLAGQRRIVDFGIDAPAQVRAQPSATANGPVTLDLPDGRVAVGLPVPGRHNLYNALAAAAGATALGIDAATIADGLQGFTPMGGRLSRQSGPAGSVLLDDTYNANPASLAAGLEVLTQSDGAAWLVLGDMGELGDEAAALHADAGERARRAGIQRLFTLGELSREAARAFGAGAQHFDDRDALLQALRRELTAGVTVLVKGSRSMGMERIVRGLQAAEPAGGED